MKSKYIRYIMIIGIVCTLIGFFVVFPENHTTTHDYLQIVLALGQLCVGIALFLLLRFRKKQGS